MIGQVLAGRYRIVEVLGTGSFGQTYVIEDTQRPGNPQCVLKHLKPARTDADFLSTARRLFNSEAETLEKLGNHDQIPRLLAYFEENKEFYLVQEFIEGHPLSAELPSGLQWTEEQVVRLLQEILSTLEFVHGQGVIHRDIKPDNLIRRNSDNKLVLIDFGAVKQIGQLSIHSQEPSNATIAIGTSGYLPTEQSQGKPRFNSDIYALGIIGLQALTGLGPHDLEEDNATGEIVWQHLVSVSPGLAKVLTQMVRYHFKDRYQTAAEAVQALQTLSPVRQPEPAKNWKLIAGLGTGGLVAILLIFTLLNSLGRQPQPSPTNDLNTPSVQDRTLAGVQNVPQGLFNYGGSTTFAPLRSQTVVGVINQAFPQFRMRYTEPIAGKPGSGKGIEMLIGGQLSFAQSSRSLKDKEYASAKSRGFTLEEVPVALDGIALYINPRLVDQGVKGLTLAQARDIFTGKIRNWQAVGGPNLAITPFSRNLQSGGIVDFFNENVMDKQPLGANVQEVRDTTESIRKVATTPGSISYATTSEVINQQLIRLIAIAKEDGQEFVSPCADSTCTGINEKAFADGSYPITRRLFVIIKRDGKADEQAGVAYSSMLLSDEGQKLSKQVGFVPIR